MPFDMTGAIDLHVHAGPSVAKRKVDCAEMLAGAQAAGYRAFVTKDHYFPSVMSCDVSQRHLGGDGTLAFGCICLNNAVGGINVHAVDAACGMGAKIVFMPTVSAQNHLEHHKKAAFVGAGGLKLPEKPIYYLDSAGQLKPEVVEVLRYLREYHPEVVLGTGHGSPAEISRLIDKAVELGLTKILVNHPFFHIGATVNQMVRWADQGAYIELNAVVFNDVEPAPHHLPIETAREVLARVGYRRMVLDSDLGQSIYIEPVAGLARFADVLMDRCGLTPEQIRVMLIDNPARLLGLDQN